MDLGKKISKQCDIVIMLCVFVLCGIYIWSWFSQEILSISEWNKLRQYFIQVALTEVVLSGCLLWKAHRLNACVFTKIATYMYSILVLTSLSYLLLDIKTQIFMMIAMGIFVIGSASMLFTYIIKRIWTGSKSLKK